ncbi:hypothetical protein HYALB_00001546 [Hymenoscyphus albidus]|uniref:Ankyrin repeat protein n=1 Tax=Hymenoscyphus albidus TaxID=595503 RepID=A0A9N9LFQ5_9HELO|nr:hypothetical protein HYALB_00001546 [Hymenoscyphus albidus]
MAASTPQEPVIFHIPKLPTESVGDFVPYVSKHPDTPPTQLLEPYKAFESELRKIYAQEPTHEAVCAPNVNLVPIFNGHEKEITVRARSLETESEEEKAQFIMPLDHKERKMSGSPAVVTSFKEFQKNFNLFSESSLIDLDWDNVVAAGSSVTTSLLPVPGKWAGSKRSMREYYHENLAPASDVDLFLYGMNEEQALEKIKQIEQRVKDSILHEVTTILTKNAITIASQYPTRHIQIVLQLYDSVSQIITGFDVDCACVAYDGKQVYAAPRAIAAFMTQCNTIDLSRRSPSYENRLSKYSHRGFEVHWPLLDRTRIDPTIFERSFGRTQGLARLLILEKLPKASDRDSYMAQRREERGRPALNRWRNQFNNSDVSSYHSMTVPYGPKYGAARITRLLYAKDLLLNAEWNQSRDREVYLHRHPCFFTGTSCSAEDILQDCCGYCPIPQTDEEIEVAEEEGKTNVSGALQFVKDDPGRQAIGSFNPITDDEWTTMAYVGDTARLCQAIVDHDIEHVQDWLQQEGVDVNRRDFVGHTPLHLATMTSTPEIVQPLIDHNARIVARLQDGRTALHITASQVNAEMVKALMDKSLENEVEEDEKREARLDAKKAERRALRQLNDLNTSKKIGYSRLFEAAWVGDLDMIKSLTPPPWASKDESDISPLQIAVRDFNGFSPFSIAVLRGHFDLARNIVSIALAQYHKDDNKDLRQRWTMNTDDSEDEDCDDENVLPIFAELINDRFTVDNLGEVSTVVKSTVLPSAMMEWPCRAGRFDDSEVKDSTHQLSLLQYVVVSDNMQILKFIIDLGAEEQALLAEEPDDQKCYSMDTSIFELAIKLGRTSMIAEMIEATGVGIPLTKFVQNSGVEAKSKPKYYQGLSVGGKKRADWAEAPHNHSRVQEYNNNPLLEAASHRSLESEFAAKNESDKRIKTLRESEKGFDRTVGTFLNAKSELLLHFAVLSRSDNEAGLNSNVENDEKHMALIKHIFSVAPETLEQKSSKGYTPLQLAILTNRNKVASYLISIGANQRHRDRSGRNMLHSMVATLHHHRKNAAGLQNMISLFNEEAVEEMLVERTSQPESATPLAYWMLHNGQSFIKPEIIAVLAKYSSGEDLTMINSEGDLPLHFAIKKGLSSITSFLLSQNSTLLYRENSTGRTPLEMSREIYHASCVKDPISISTSRAVRTSHLNSTILSRAPATFLPDSKEPEPEESKKRTFEICMEMDEKMAAEGGDRKRRLVSLNEASEVAKRVGLRSGGRRYGGSQAVINDGLIDGEGADDVGSCLSHHKVKDIAADIVGILCGTKIAVVWTLAVKVENPQWGPPIDVLKQLVLQVLRLIVCLLEEQSMTLRAT